MTRVIAGVAGGKRLAVPGGSSTRPTSDRAREGLFGTVVSEFGSLSGLHAADLYAGSGAVGLEALSRGAASVLLVESDARAAEVIRANVVAVGLAGARVRQERVERVLARPADDRFDLVFADPPKASAPAAVARLAAAGVRVVILSGDDPLVVGRLAKIVGLRAQEAMVGADLNVLSIDALRVQTRDTDVFARLSPDQKVRIVHALRAAGEVVGFLGDGVNDAPGIKAADVGLSVDGATSVARAAADMILLESDLAVVADGVEEGRRTFANILKYVRMGASSNFGNMLSMAVASLYLPFLPMLATQILLNNLLLGNRHTLRQRPLGRHRSATALADTGYRAVRRGDGPAVFGFRPGHLRRALPMVPNKSRGVPNWLVR